MEVPGLSAEQRALRDALWSLLSGCYCLDQYDDAHAQGWSAEVWDAVRGPGAIGIHVAENLGGQSGGLADLCVVAEAFGRALYDGPYLTSQLAGFLVSRVAWPEGAGKADSIVRGDLQVAMPWRWLEADSCPSLALSSRKVSGEVNGVLNAVDADLMILMCNQQATDVRRCVAVLAEDYTVTSTSSVLDRTRPVSRVVFHNAPVLELTPLDGDRRRLLHDLADLSSLVVSAEQLGVASRCLDDVVEYLGTRSQFGRPIGSFQALRHRVADLLLDVEALRSLVYSAASIDQHSEHFSAEVDCARRLASNVGVSVAGSAIQLHGGFGFTWEARVHHYLRRAKLNQSIFTGGAELARLAQGLAGAEDTAVSLVPGRSPDDDRSQMRAEVRNALSTVLPPGWTGFAALREQERETFLKEWRSFQSDRRWLALEWPREYGGSGLTEAQQVVLQEEFARADVPAVPDVSDVMGIHLLGNTLIAHGTSEQRKHFLPRILSGTDRWCQGFSEPNAGSDLAGIQTRAELRDGRWVINGQKIWTSGARQANWIFLLARTEPTRPKHQGLTFLLVPMHQEAIEVRSIRQISGAEDFCEVFLSDAVTDESNIVGKPGEGWDVAMSLLRFERGSTATALAWRLGEEFRQIVYLAKSAPGTSAAASTTRLADTFVRLRSLEALSRRMVAGDLPGSDRGVDASLYKLSWSHYWQVATELAVDLCIDELVTAPATPGPVTVDAGHLGPADDPHFWWQKYLNARAATIYAGTSEIQRDIVAGRILGLPR